MIITKYFTAADLATEQVGADAGAKYLIWSHGKNTAEVQATWIDNDGFERLTAGLFRVLNNSIVLLNVGDPVVGTHRLMLSYNEAAVSVTGKRAFELEEIDDPATNYRIIFGKAAASAANMTFAKLLVWLGTNLNFANKQLSNLSPDIETAQDNLQVYSKSATNVLLNAKATAFVGGTGQALLSTDNPNYSPSNPKSPATKEYVDGMILRRGQAVIGDLSTGTIGILFSSALPTSDYMVIGTLKSADSTGYCYAYDVNTFTTTGFTLHTNELGASVVENMIFQYIVLPL
jgi:hypothetical protein